MNTPTPHSTAPKPHGSFALARILLALTVAWNIVEFVVALWAGDRADSLALIGFGLDSGIETFAAVFALLTFGSLSDPDLDDEAAESRDRRLHQVVGGTFLALSLWIGIQAAIKLLGGEPAQPSGIGLILAIISLVVMPFLGFAKYRNAERLGASGLMAEAKETIACAYLSFTLLAGLAAHMWLNLNWIDSLTALFLIPWLVKEGLEGLRGDDD